MRPWKPGDSASCSTTTSSTTGPRRPGAGSAEEYTPVVRILHAADLVGSGTDAEAYLTIARERYRLIRTHEWNDEVIEELQRKFRASRWRIRPSVTTPSGQPTADSEAIDQPGGDVADQPDGAAAAPARRRNR